MHHQFFQASPMKLLPLISALLLSAAPVQASQTVEELMKPCEASKEAAKACFASSIYATSYSHHQTICAYSEAGLLTIEDKARDKIPVFNSLMNANEIKVVWNQGILVTLEKYPNCPIKPIP